MTFLAIEKMMFVRATGPVDKLNEFNLKTLLIDYYHPENATEYMSGTDGWQSLFESDPFDSSIRNIEEISSLTGIDLKSHAQLIFSDKTPSNKEYLKKLTGYITSHNFETSDISSFLSALHSVVSTYSVKHSQLQARQKELEQNINKLKHFAQLDISPDELMNTSLVELHFGSLPKDSMIKLYMYTDDNKFIFKTYSSDDKYFWGVYCVPKHRAEEAKKIMSALYFDELVLDLTHDSVQDIIASCKAELEQVTENQRLLTQFWESNREELIYDYSILLNMQQLWNFRKYAVVKGETFCCLGWIPKKKQHEARELFASVGEIEFTIKDPETSITATSNSGSSPFERSIRDIEHLAHHVGFQLTPDKLHNCIGNKRPLTKEYLEKFTKYLGGSDINSDEGGTFNINSKIHSLAKGRKELKAREKQLKTQLELLSHYTSLDLDLSQLMSVKYTVVHFGSIPVEYVNIIKQLADEKNFIFYDCSQDKNYCYCLYCVPKKYASEVADIFESYRFREFNITDTSGTVESICEKYKKDLETIEKQNQLITDFWNKHEAEILDCYSILEDLQRLWNSRQHITEKNGKYVYSGNATMQDKKEILTLYETVGGFSVSGAKADESVTHSQQLSPPTKLRNLKIFQPYEYYVKMYGMPGYNSIDITSFVAITYTVLFGIMFGDLGQGLILAIFGALAWKIKKMELGKILVPCGISSMCFGLVFGSFFGYEHFLDPLYHAVGMKGKPLEVMDNINTVLLIAISIGIGLVAVSIILNIYASIKNKKFGAALFDNNGLAGLILYLCGVNLVVDFMAGIEFLPNAVCIVLMVICAVILFLKEILIGIVDKHENWKPDSISDFIMQNVFEMLEYVLSYFSNTVSFLRVGAFVLVHSGMMMVVFSLAGESENIFVVILGNILVICLEGLLTGIQALRLEFYEMFSRCFAGDGKPFVSAKSILNSDK